jgi:hypothetical protein
VTILFYLKFLKLYLGDRSVIEKVVENLPNPNGAGHSPHDSRFLVHPVLELTVVFPDSTLDRVSNGGYETPEEYKELLDHLKNSSVTAHVIIPDSK